MSRDPNIFLSQAQAGDESEDDDFGHQAGQVNMRPVLLGHPRGPQRLLSPLMAGQEEGEWELRDGRLDGGLSDGLSGLDLYRTRCEDDQQAKQHGRTDGSELSSNRGSPMEVDGEAKAAYESTISNVVTRTYDIGPKGGSAAEVWTATELENLYGKETGLRVNLQWADVAEYPGVPNRDTRYMIPFEFGNARQRDGSLKLDKNQHPYRWSPTKTHRFYGRMEPVETVHPAEAGVDVNWPKELLRHDCFDTSDFPPRLEVKAPPERSPFYVPHAGIFDFHDHDSRYILGNVYINSYIPNPKGDADDIRNMIMPLHKGFRVVDDILVREASDGLIPIRQGVVYAREIDTDDGRGFPMTIFAVHTLQSLMYALPKDKYTELVNIVHRQSELIWGKRVMETDEKGDVKEVFEEGLAQIALVPNYRAKRGERQSKKQAQRQVRLATQPDGGEPTVDQPMSNDEVMPPLMDDDEDEDEDCGWDDDDDETAGVELTEEDLMQGKGKMSRGNVSATLGLTDVNGEGPGWVHVGVQNASPHFRAVNWEYQILSNHVYNHIMPLCVSRFEWTNAVMNEQDVNCFVMGGFGGAGATSVQENRSNTSVKWRSPDDVAAVMKQGAELPRAIGIQGKLHLDGGDEQTWHSLIQFAMRLSREQFRSVVPGGFLTPYEGLYVPQLNVVHSWAVLNGRASPHSGESPASIENITAMLEADKTTQLVSKLWNEAGKTGEANRVAFVMYTGRKAFNRSVPVKVSENPFFGTAGTQQPRVDYIRPLIGADENGTPTAAGEHLLGDRYDRDLRVATEFACLSHNTSANYGLTQSKTLVKDAVTAVHVKYSGRRSHYPSISDISFENLTRHRAVYAWMSKLASQRIYAVTTDGMWKMKDTLLAQQKAVTLTTKEAPQALPLIGSTKQVAVVTPNLEGQDNTIRHSGAFTDMRWEGGKQQFGFSSAGKDVQWMSPKEIRLSHLISAATAYADRVKSFIPASFILPHRLQCNDEVLACVTTEVHVEESLRQLGALVSQFENSRRQTSTVGIAANAEQLGKEERLMREYWQKQRTRTFAGYGQWTLELVASTAAVLEADQRSDSHTQILSVIFQAHRLEGLHLLATWWTSGRKHDLEPYVAQQIEACRTTPPSSESAPGTCLIWHIWLAVNAWARKGNGELQPTGIRVWKKFCSARKLTTEFLILPKTIHGLSPKAGAYDLRKCPHYPTSSIVNAAVHGKVVDILVHILDEVILFPRLETLFGKKKHEDVKSRVIVQGALIAQLTDLFGGQSARYLPHIQTFCLENPTSFFHDSKLESMKTCILNEELPSLFPSPSRSQLLRAEELRTRFELALDQIAGIAPSSGTSSKRKRIDPLGALAERVEEREDEDEDEGDDDDDFEPPPPAKRTRGRTGAKTSATKTKAAKVPQTRDAVHPALAVSLAEVQKRLLRVGILMLEAVRLEETKSCAVTEHQRYFEGKRMDNGLPSKDPNPDHRNPFRIFNVTTKLFHDSFTTSTLLTSRRGLANSMTFHGFGNGFKTQDAFKAMARPFHEDTVLAEFKKHKAESISDTKCWGQPCRQLAVTSVNKTLEDKLAEFWQPKLLDGWEGFLTKYGLLDVNLSTYTGPLPSVKDFDVYFKDEVMMGKGRTAFNICFLYSGPTLTRLQTMNTFIIEGLLDPLTPEEMGDHINHLGKGAIAALRLLGFYVETETDVRHAFLIVHKFLESALRGAVSQTIWDRLKYRSYTTEHALCKVGRWFNSDEEDPWKLLSDAWFEAVENLVTKWRDFTEADLCTAMFRGRGQLSAVKRMICDMNTAC